LDEEMLKHGGLVQENGYSSTKIRKFAMVGKGRNNTVHLP
jgi:hypothetical protein